MAYTESLWEEERTLQSKNHIISGSDGGSQKRNAQQLLDGWTHKNGEPCGVREDK